MLAASPQVRHQSRIFGALEVAPHRHICPAPVSHTLCASLSVTHSIFPPYPVPQAASWMVGNQYKPAELGKAEWETVRESPPWAVDAWGLGCLIQEICSCTSMKSVEDLRC